MTFSYQQVWAKQLDNRRVVVHLIGGLRNSTDPDGHRRSTVRTACGSNLIMTWANRHTDDYGVRLAEGHADAIGAKRCGRCFRPGGGAR